MDTSKDQPKKIKPIVKHGVKHGVKKIVLKEGPVRRASKESDSRIS
jgi:hypothetical protein